jgi:hypothetical protein
MRWNGKGWNILMFHCLDYKNNNGMEWNGIGWNGFHPIPPLSLNFVPSNLGGK